MLLLDPPEDQTWSTPAPGICHNTNTDTIPEQYGREVVKYGCQHLHISWFDRPFKSLMGINQEVVLKQQGQMLPLSSAYPHTPGMGLPLGTTGYPH